MNLNKNNDIKTIVIIGQPNAGKSTLFNVLSDIKTSTSNFSGTSVALSECLIDILGETYKLVDLPGSYSLNPSDKAEEVTISYLLNEKYDFIINVVDCTLLARNLELTTELLELNKPFIIALNMFDEAIDKGLEIYPEKLQSILNVPVVTISALFGKGIRNLVDRCSENINSGNFKATKPKFTKHIEKSIIDCENIIRNSKFDSNFSLF